MNRSRSPAASLPHSWDLEHWPEFVYPHSESRGRYLVRMHREELTAAGVLTRVGRELVVLGNRYDRWLAGKTVDVPEFEIAANRQKGRAQDSAGAAPP
ncbi:MAG: hypothetical protein WBE92_12185 [Steroidobacteraceae bacterium]